MNLTPGRRLTLKIDDLAFGGEGVARLEEFVIFVPFVMPDETVDAEITAVKKRFARAKLLRVVSPSPQRAEPPCRYFGSCGGCQYQHIDYPVQLRLKHGQIVELLRRIGGFDAARVAPVIPCPQPYGYRNRVMIRSQWNKPEHRLNIGFVRWDCGLVEDITECRIAEPAINDQIRRVREQPPPRGGLKVVLRIPPDDWDVPPDAFFQNNFFLLPRLVETVRDLVRASGSRHLIDLYCGVGFFGIELADLVESFAGIEYDHQAVGAARRNAERHRRVNGEFVAAKVEDALPMLFKRFAPGMTTVLLDPPRKGCHSEVLDLLRRERPAQVVYISCHPATLARDLNALAREDVFELMQVIPLDMFPQTQHVECVAAMRCRLPADSSH